MARLILRHRDAAIILATETTIGRSPSCDIPITMPDISRLHCRLSCVNGRWTVTDLHSLNGTYVNGERILPDTTVHLDAGDTLQVGRINWTVEFEAAQAAQAA